MKNVSVILHGDCKDVVIEREVTKFYRAYFLYARPQHSYLSLFSSVYPRIVIIDIAYVTVSRKSYEMGGSNF